MITIPLGMMDRCVWLESEVTQRGTDGNWTKVWTQATAKAIRAAYEYRSGGERIEANQEQGNRVVSWTIRYIDGVTERWRLLHKNDIYDIESVEEIGKRRYLRLWCRKKTVYQEK